LFYFRSCPNDVIRPVWDGPSAEELYDHAGDDSSSFDRWENTNLAAKNPGAVKTLKEQMLAFFNKH